MSESDIFYKEIFSLYGSIKRARGPFLYTQKGVRLTDLYQEGGRAILGWGGTSAFTMLKNTLNRGICGSFETGFSYRLKKAVEDLFASEREVFVFYSKAQAVKAALLLSSDGTNFYKPWSSSEIKWADLPCIVFAPPLPWCQSLYILAANSSLVSKFREIILSSLSEERKALFSDSDLFPGSEILPAPLYASLARSIYDLRKALQERKESDWFIYDTVITKYWERKGPYLFPKVPRENYGAFLLHCLKLGLLVSPDYNTPSIVPFGADKGVFTCLKNSPFDF
ncbi:MAG: hypothetical protein K6E78_10910 [Treponema sp.]|nr:hypothetical protein [Treponema sp.]